MCYPLTMKLATSASVSKCFLSPIDDLHFLQDELVSDHVQIRIVEGCLKMRELDDLPTVHHGVVYRLVRPFGFLGRDLRLKSLDGFDWCVSQDRREYAGRPGV